MEMAKSVPSLYTPEFKNPPTPSFYSASEFPGHYGAGMLSPYGELLLFTTQHIAATGQVDPTVMTEQLYEWADSKHTGRKDGALKAFVENIKAGKTYPECGADDSQAMFNMKVVPVTCLYAGKPEMKQKVEEAIRVHQNNDVAVAFGVASACILERALLTGSLPDASFVESLDVDQQVKDAWNKAAKFSELEPLMLQISHEAMKGKEDSPFYDLAGRSCAMPGAFIAPSFLFQEAGKNSTCGKDAYAEALRANILASGDTCSRAVFIGSVLAAASGDVPQDWVDKVDKETMDQVDALANKIAELVGAE
jgi:ADP-ribosylglycohydrolase